MLWSIAAWCGEHAPVFILHSYSQEYPWTKRQHEGFLDALAENGNLRIVPTVEYLDTKRVGYDPEYAAGMAAHLAWKYRGYRPAVIYVTDDNALNFALSHLGGLFPLAPIFFSGVNNLQLRDTLDPRRVTGVFEQKDIAPNLELMRHIAPDVRDILVVGDDSETYAAIRTELDIALRHQPDIRARFVSGRRLSTLLGELSGRSERFVFLTTLGGIGDDAGQPLPLADTIAAIAAAGPFTIISMEDVYLQPGVLGGYVTSGVRQGAAAAALARRYLEGTPLEQLPALSTSPNEYLIDATELLKTGLRLPDDIAAQARILNQPPGFYARHQNIILTALYLLAALFLLLLFGSLLVLMRKNRQILRGSAALTEQARHLIEVRESLTRAQHIAGMGNWDWHIDTDQHYWSDECCRVFGIDAASARPSYAAFLACVHPEDRARIGHAVREALENRTDYDVVHRIVRPDGEERIVRENAEIVRDAQGNATRMIGTVLDITQQARAEQALRDNEAMLRTVIQGFPIILWVIDRNGVFLLSEGKGLEEQGLKPGQVVGESLFERYRDYPDSLRDAQRALNGESFTAISWLDDAAFEVHYTPLLGPAREITGAIGVAADITERKRTEDRLSFLANFDPLTRLPNRALFNDRLAHAMQHADRDGDVVALLFIDLDNFKSINDTLGHSEGDELLRQVAQRLQTAVRSGDTVSRLGGDEFTIILENLTHEEEAARVAADIIQQACEPYQLLARDFYVSPSIGIAFYPQDGGDVQSLLMSADAAMYRAKENGRNNYQFFNKDISDAAQEHLALSTLLRGALARGEFSLHYQPQIDVRDGRVLGFEALLRCRSAMRGMIPPNVFIPILEATGQIIPVGEWVLQEACRWAASLDEWAGAGLTPPAISVNISARQFRQHDLAQTVAAALTATGLDAGRLELEITESCLLDAEGQLQTMERLKRLGVRLSIDDFGTGYSSLSYLKRFPLDRLKIDGSFVRDVTEDANDAALVTTIIGLAGNLGLQVIAEGVETVGQVDFLMRQGCAEIQGYLVARPMPADAVMAWWDDWCRQGYAGSFGNPPPAHGSCAATGLRTDQAGRH
ncbi:MAG TPA: EAL domain-containing protein [Gammaproteobacteria bacterium]